mgnify:CR=1 FL=1
MIRTILLLALLISLSKAVLKTSGHNTAGLVTSTSKKVLSFRVADLQSHDSEAKHDKLTRLKALIPGHKGSPKKSQLTTDPQNYFFNLQLGVGPNNTPVSFVVDTVPPLPGYLLLSAQLCLS